MQKQVQKKVDEWVKVEGEKLKAMVGEQSQEVDNKLSIRMNRVSATNQGLREMIDRVRLDVKEVKVDMKEVKGVHKVVEDNGEAMEVMQQEPFHLR